MCCIAAVTDTQFVLSASWVLPVSRRSVSSCAAYCFAASTVGSIWVLDTQQTCLRAPLGYVMSSPPTSVRDACSRRCNEVVIFRARFTDFCPYTSFCRYVPLFVARRRGLSGTILAALQKKRLARGVQLCGHGDLAAPRRLTCDPNTQRISPCTPALCRAGNVPLPLHRHALAAPGSSLAS